ERGYHVTGIDVSDSMLARARAEAPPRASYRLLDMREIDTLEQHFDAALILWQSFGNFDAATNAAILAAIARRLEPRGRLVLDISHRDFCAERLAPRARTVEGRNVVESKRLDGSRLTVTLDYGRGEQDVFSWDIYTPAEVDALASAAGFARVLAC